MIPIRGNWLGLAMFVVSGLIAAICGLVLKLGDFRTMVTVGTSLFVMDLVFRLAVRKGDGWLFGKNTGGYFFFVPVWILGLIVIAINIVNASGLLK